MTNGRWCNHWSHIRVESAYNAYADWTRAGDSEKALQLAIRQVDCHMASGKCRGHRAPRYNPGYSGMGSR